MELSPPVIEIVLKESELEEDALVNHSHIYAMKAATPEEIGIRGPSRKMIRMKNRMRIRKTARRNAVKDAAVDGSSMRRVSMTCLQM